VKCLPSMVLASGQEIGCMTRRWLFKVMSLHLGNHSCLEPLSADVALMVALMGWTLCQCHRPDVPTGRACMIRKAVADEEGAWLRPKRSVG